MLEEAYSSYADENRRSFDKEDRQVRQSYTKKTPTMMVGVVWLRKDQSSSKRAFLRKASRRRAMLGSTHLRGVPFPS